MLLQKTLVLRYCGAFDSPSLAKRFNGAATESEDKRLHEQILKPFKVPDCQLREGRQASILFDVKRCGGPTVARGVLSFDTPNGT